MKKFSLLVGLTTIFAFNLLHANPANKEPLLSYDVKSADLGSCLLESLNESSVLQANSYTSKTLAIQNSLSYKCTTNISPTIVLTSVNGWYLGNSNSTIPYTLSINGHYTNVGNTLNENTVIIDESEKDIMVKSYDQLPEVNFPKAESTAYKDAVIATIFF